VTPSAAPAPGLPAPPTPAPSRRRLDAGWASAAFAARTTAAAQLALVAAWSLDLRHTHWAAMTVWLTAQPTRGLLLDKSVLRVVGTLFGAAVGFTLLALFPGHTVALVAGLTAWTALCAGASAFVRPARAYGIILAGYTAVMLALPSSADGASAQGLFGDRVLCTLIGVLVSAVVTGLLTPRERPEDLDAPLRRLGDEVFAFAHGVRTPPVTAAVVARQRHLVAEIGRLGERADQTITGFFGARRRRRKVRRALRALLGLLVESRIVGERETASTLAVGASVPPAPEPIPPTASGDALVARIRAGAVRRRDGGAARIAPGSAVRHAPGARSWANHREAAVATVKTVTGMAIVGAIWWATGWHDGSTMLVSAAVFLTLFSANDSARAWVGQILLGSMAGGVAAVLYVLLLPLASTPVETALLATPFLLIGAFAMARPLTAKVAVDFNMVFLMATPAAFTLQGGVRDTASRVVAVVVGVLAATLFFHATHEGAPRRVARLARGVVSDLRKIAASAEVEEARLRRGSLADRVVRMAIAAETDEGLAPFAETAVDLLALGAALTRLVPLREVGAPAGAPGGPVATALERLGDAIHDPSACAAELERAAGSLAGSAPASPAGDAARYLRDAARILRRQDAPLGR
jgi:uncharacterized membrane protein YccC